MAYAGDPRQERVETQLRKVRTRLTEARSLIGRQRRHEHRTLPDVREQGDPRVTALSWLTRAFPDEHRVLREQMLRERGLEAVRAHGGSRDVFDSLDEACAHGWVIATTTPAVTALLEMDASAFRNTVANDARDQNERNIPLRHPAVLRRWHATLVDLLEMTVAPAHASSVNALGSLTVDLHQMPEEKAFHILNARRFFAAVMQRKTECQRTLRQLMNAASLRKQEDPDVVARAQAELAARERLAEAHPAEFEHILERLRPFQTPSGRLDMKRMDTNLRGELKARTIKEIAAVTAVSS